MGIDYRVLSTCIMNGMGLLLGFISPAFSLFFSCNLYNFILLQLFNCSITSHEIWHVFLSLSNSSSHATIGDGLRKLLNGV